MVLIKARIDPMKMRQAADHQARARQQDECERNLRDDPEYAAHWAGVIPTGRVGQPGDVASALLYLVSPDAAMVTGHTLVVDGGWTAVGDVPG